MTNAADYSKTLEQLSPTDWFPFATFVKNRSDGDFKRHKTLAHAKASISGGGNSQWSWKGRHEGFEIYEWNHVSQSWEVYVD